jgi:hypothetical protein
MLGWAGLGWAGLGWAGLGWAGLGWAGLGWAGLGWAHLVESDGPRSKVTGHLHLGLRKPALAVKSLLVFGAVQNDFVTRVIISRDVCDVIDHHSADSFTPVHLVDHDVLDVPDHPKVVNEFRFDKQRRTCHQTLVICLAYIDGQARCDVGAVPRTAKVIKLLKVHVAVRRKGAGGQLN